MRRYSPQFVFSPLPMPGDMQTDFAPPTLDYGVAPQQNGELRGRRKRGVSRVAAVVADRDRSAAARSGSLTTITPYAHSAYGGGYSYSVSRYASLRLGYAQQDTDYPAFRDDVQAAIHAADLRRWRELLEAVVDFAPDDGVVRYRLGGHRRRHGDVFQRDRKRVALITRSAARGKRTSCTPAVSALSPVSSSRSSPIR